MSTILYPFNIVDGDPESAGPVMANFQAVSAVVNGALELGTNVIAAAPQAQNGSTISGGSSLSALRSDAQFVIRGVEQLTADPGSGNFDGRVYYNTSTHKLRQFISSAWQSVSNLTYAELPAIPNNTITAPMMGRSLVTAAMAGNVGLADAAWTTIISSFSVTTTGANQLVSFLGHFNASETGGSTAALVGWRIREGSTTIASGAPTYVPAGTDNAIRIASACANLATGAHTLTLQASKGASGTISARQTTTVNSEAIASQLQVVVG